MNSTSLVGEFDFLTLSVLEFFPTLSNGEIHISDNQFYTDTSTNISNQIKWLNCTESRILLLKKRKPISKLEQHQESNRLTGTETINPSPSIRDLDLSIVIRKDIRQCAQHPIALFVSTHDFLQSMQLLSQTLTLLLFLSLFMEHWRTQNWLLLWEMRWEHWIKMRHGGS